MEPILARLVSKNELEAREDPATHLGFVLDGEPSDAWLRTLQRATSSDAAAGNALRVMEILIGDAAQAPTSNTCHGNSESAVAAYLEDVGRSPNQHSWLGTPPRSNSAMLIQVVE